MALLLIVSVVGCAQKKVEPRFALPADAKIAMVDAHFDEQNDSGDSSASETGGGAVAGAIGSGLVGAVGYGLGGAVVGAFQGLACGPLVGLCVPLFAAGGAAVGIVGGGAYGAFKGAQAGAQNAERSAKDKSKDAENTEQSSEVMSKEDLNAALQLIEKSIASLPPISGRVRRLVAPPSAQPDYWIEFNPPKVEFINSWVKIDQNIYVYQFAISCQARVVGILDKSEIERHKFNIYLTFSSAEMVTSPTTENVKARITKLDSALDQCAAWLVGYWGVPTISAIEQNASQTAPAAVITPNEDYLECVKRGTGKCDDYVSCFSGGTRQWTNKSKCDSRNSPESAKETITNKNKELSGIRTAIPATAQPSEQTSSSTAPSTTEPPKEPSRTETTIPATTQPPKKPDDSAFPACFSWGCRSGPPQ